MHQDAESSPQWPEEVLAEQRHASYIGLCSLVDQNSSVTPCEFLPLGSSIVSHSPYDKARDFFKTSPFPVLKSLAVPRVDREPRLLPSSLIILAFWRKKLDCFALQISKHPINTAN